MNTWDSARWRTSSYSDGNTNCVEVAGGAEHVGVRDSKDRTSGHLAVSTSSWSGLVTAIAGA